MNEIIVYPVYMAQLGGAVHVKHGKRSAEVQLSGRAIRLPLSEVRMYLDDGMKVADVAKAWAYRNQ